MKNHFVDKNIPADAQGKKQQRISVVSQDPSENDSDNSINSQPENQFENCQTQSILTVFCGICKDFIVHSATASCEHTFCQMCLSEYMLYMEDCPICEKPIRQQKISSNLLLDSIINQYIQKYEPADFKAYQERYEEYKVYLSNRNLGEFEAGMAIDVRDVDYVWRKGRICRTVNKLHEKKVKYMIVKYQGSHKKEELPENSPRVAKLGFYTDRHDLPKYSKGKVILEDRENQRIYHLTDFYSQDQGK